MKTKSMLHANKISKFLRNSWPPLLMLVLIIALWEGIVYFFNVPYVVIPAPHLIVAETAKYFKSELLRLDIFRVCHSEFSWRLSFPSPSWRSAHFLR